MYSVERVASRDVSIYSLNCVKVPPQEGGVDYKEQYELMQLAILALLD